MNTIPKIELQDSQSVVGPSKTAPGANSLGLNPLSRNAHQNNSASFYICCLLSFIAFQAIAILLVESVFALSGIGAELIQKDDTVLGFKHRQNKSVTWRREGFSKATFNSEGLFENVAPGAHPGVYRVAVFGDSMVEGLQEPQENSFIKLLENKLQGRTAGKLQVMNCGVFGYSAVQAFLYADEIIDKYKPDLILYGYDTRDMSESIETWAPAGMKSCGGRPYAIKLPGRNLEISSEPVVNALKQNKNRFWAQFDWFQQNSRIWGYLTENRPKLSLHNAFVDAITGFGKPADTKKEPAFSIRFFERSKTANLTENGQIKKAQQLNVVEQNLKVAHLSILDETFGALLVRLNQHCVKSNAKLIVFSLPSRCDLLHDIAALPSPYSVDMQDELKIVRTHCGQQNIPFIDIHDKACNENQSEQRKFFYILHLTARGHRYVFSQLAPFLDDYLQAQATLKI